MFDELTDYLSEFKYKMEIDVIKDVGKFCNKIQSIEMRNRKNENPLFTLFLPTQQQKTEKQMIQTN